MGMKADLAGLDGRLSVEVVAGADAEVEVEGEGTAAGWEEGAVAELLLALAAAVLPVVVVRP